MDILDNAGVDNLIKKIEKDRKREILINALIKEKNKKLLLQTKRSNVDFFQLFYDYYKNNSFVIKTKAVENILFKYRTDKNINSKDFKSILVWLFNSALKEKKDINNVVYVSSFSLFDVKKENNLLSHHISEIYDGIWDHLDKKTQFNVFKNLANSHFQNKNIDNDWFFKKLKDYNENINLNEKNELIYEIFTRHGFCQILTKKQAWFFLENYRGQIKTKNKYNILQSYISNKWSGKINILDEEEIPKVTYVLNKEEELFLFKKFNIEYNIKYSLNKKEHISPFDNIVLSILYGNKTSEDNFFSSTWEYILSHYYKEIKKFESYNGIGGKFFKHLVTVNDIDTLKILVKYNIIPEKVGESSKDIVKNSYYMSNEIKSIFDNEIKAILENIKIQKRIDQKNNSTNLVNINRMRNKML